ncbi:hypothetical protein GPA10_37535 [Streptomyces sp. p1417]|uniref:Uncharacterized protein n=1 Tax=Streptomyces typhae TaxID=2681492 RepID=A0A6L6X8X9_9ACTN|nr:hypothetical protein [Streptomyces typhae]MVO90304.1 hypothetical protein [Streptomyces typhae]
MTDPSTYPVRLAEDIASLIETLHEHLCQATRAEAGEILGTVLDPEDGVLSRLTDLLGTGSRFAQNQAHNGMLPPEVCLAMGRTVNELNSVGEDLAEPVDSFKKVAAQPSATHAFPPKPAASAMVVRRSR